MFINIEVHPIQRDGYGWLTAKLRSFVRVSDIRELRKGTTPLESVELNSKVEEIVGRDKLSEFSTVIVTDTTELEVYESIPYLEAKWKQ